MFSPDLSFFICKIGVVRMGTPHPHCPQMLSAVS